MTKKTIRILLILFLISVTGFSQTLNKKTLCKKWYIEKYRVMWKNYQPETKEKNDYILLKNDMTYESIDEGVFNNGKWTYNEKKKYFILFDEKGKGLKFIVDKLSDKKMVLNIDIKELEGVDIHYCSIKSYMIK